MVQMLLGVMLCVIWGGENGCGCKQMIMGAGRCVRELLGGCLPHFWWGGQGVLVFVWRVGSIFWVFGMCDFLGL